MVRAQADSNWRTGFSKFRRNSTRRVKMPRLIIKSIDWFLSQDKNFLG